jgi:flagellar protein FlgJ
MSADGARAAARLRQTAQEFEGMFLGLLLKTMRSSAGGGGTPQGPDSQMYREMFDVEVGQSLAKAGGIGLARMITQSQEPKNSLK